MARLPRSASQVILIACVVGLALITSMNIAAQEDDIQIVGSGIALPLLENLANAAEQAVTVDITGTVAGFQAFCNGEASLVTAARAINATEDALCATNGVTYSELLVANNILALITNPTDDLPVCLSTIELDDILPPSAAGRVEDWIDYVLIDAESGETAPPMAVFLPELNSLNYTLLDSVVSGDGFRSDAVLTTENEVIANTSETSGALGVVSLGAALAAGDSVSILNVSNAATGAGCVAPSTENVEASTYTFANSILLYVADSARENLAGFLTQITSEDVAPTIAESGFVAVSSNARDINSAIIAGESTDGRQFSTAQTSFQVPPVLNGEIIIAGTGSGYNYVNRILTTVVEAQQSLNIRYQIEGNVAGIRRLCNGEADIVISTADMTDEQNSACDANDIVPVSVSIGTQAAVLLANANSEFATCLTTDQLTTIWAATDSESAISNWNQVDGAFPDQEMMLFAPAVSSIYSDMLLQHTSPLLPIREDSTINNDVLYRAAATANVDASITYMSWIDYLRVVDNNQANIQLVAIDAGAGCVTPSEDTIISGEYPLTTTTQLLISQSSLADINLQALIWTLFEDNNLSELQSSGYVGVTGNALPALRQSLEREFGAATDALVVETDAASDDTSEGDATENSEEATSDESEDAADNTEAEETSD